MPAIALTLALIAQTAAVPDGNRLKAGTQCYTMVHGEKVMGVARQSITATRIKGVPAWDIVVHQLMPGGKFDMRDHFVVRRSDLTPITFENRKLGVEHVRVAYSEGKAVATWADKPATTAAFTGKIWEGNLWGLTFAALPLAEGATFKLPWYQYDKGLGSFDLAVVGSEKVAGQDAWIVEATTDGRKVRYFIGKTSRAELGYASGPFGQRLGGDCSVIPA